MKPLNYFTKLWLFIAASLYSLLVTQCGEPDHKALYFIGDSIIARWDLDEYFHGYVTHNLGVSGANIDYIESLSSQERDRDVIIMIGSNDMWPGIDIDGYAGQYVDALTALDARRIYLFSILPRDFNGENNLNPVIERVNLAIKDKISAIGNITYIDIYNAFLTDGHIDYDLYSDRLHLSPQGYEVLAKALHKQL